MFVNFIVFINRKWLWRERIYDRDGYFEMFRVEGEDTLFIEFKLIQFNADLILPTLRCTFCPEAGQAIVKLSGTQDELCCLAA
jgi:hypothetical protein